MADARELRTHSQRSGTDGVRPGQQARQMARARDTARRREETLASQSATPPPSAPVAPTHRAGRPKEKTRRTRGILVAASGAVVVTLAAIGATTVLDGGDGNIGVAADNPETPAPTMTTSQSPPGTPPQATSTEIRSVLSGPGEVTTDQRLTGVDISELELTVRSGPSEGLLSFSPQIDGLTITADGQPVTSAPTELSAGDVVVVELPQPADTVDIHFRAQGQVARTYSTVEGRGYVLVNGLIVMTSPPAAPVTVRLSDPGVLNLACSAGDDQLPCGHPSGRGWTVRLPESYMNDAVLAQVDNVS
ncbi:hypothetical protein BH18ACT8_BH18ACT8_11180 [soil metagenome]